MWEEGTSLLQNPCVCPRKRQPRVCQGNEVMGVLARELLPWKTNAQWSLSLLFLSGQGCSGGPAHTPLPGTAELGFTVATAIPLTHTGCYTGALNQVLLFLSPPHSPPHPMKLRGKGKVENENPGSRNWGGGRVSPGDPHAPFCPGRAPMPSTVPSRVSSQQRAELYRQVA